MFLGSGALFFSLNRLNRTNQTLTLLVFVQVYNAHGDYKRALNYFIKSERCAERNLQSVFRRAHTLALLDRCEEALLVLESLTDYASSECNVHYLKGKILKRLGRHKDAVMSWTMAMDCVRGRGVNLIKESIGMFFLE